MLGAFGLADKDCRPLSDKRELTGRCYIQVIGPAAFGAVLGVALHRLPAPVLQTRHSWGLFWEIVIKPALVRGLP